MRMIEPPIAADIRAARLAAGLTQAQAAEMVHVATRTWQDWERGVAEMPGAAWELFLLKTKRQRKNAEAPRFRRASRPPA